MKYVIYKIKYNYRNYKTFFVCSVQFYFVFLVKKNIQWIIIYNAQDTVFKCEKQVIQ